MSPAAEATTVCRICLELIAIPGAPREAEHVACALQHVDVPNARILGLRLQERFERAAARAA